MPDALKKADEVLQQAVEGITDLINVPGLINLDYADIQTVMIDKGIAHIGIGKAKGDDKVIEAVKQAVSSPLLDRTIEGASHVIINISGDISLIEANDAASYVQELAGDDANIIFGAMYDDSKADEATITVIATGLHNVGGTASKLKSRLESQRPAANVGHTATHTGHASAYDRQPVRQQAAPKLDMSMGSVNRTVEEPEVPRRTVGGTLPSMETPRTPTSRVKEQSIKIPDFFKK